jgi:thiaminase
MTKWRNSIQLKKYLSDNSDNESVLKVVNGILPQLKYIRNIGNRHLDKNEGNNSIVKENIEYYNGQLEELIEEFDWIKNSVESNEDDPRELGYDDWCDALNEYLSQLYDLGDSVVEYKSHFDTEKFMWVG